MGKKILQQRRGRGTKVFRASLNKIAPARYPKLDSDITKYDVRDLVHETGRGSPLMQLKPVDKTTSDFVYLPAVEGISVGSTLEISPQAELKVGNILPLHSIPESTIVCNIELRPGDGGAIARASGMFGTVMSRTSKYVAVKLPSGRIKRANPNSRAMVGIIAGGGRTEKPFLKAGKKFAWKKSNAKLGRYPVVRGTAMNHHVHPFGGGAHKHPHISTTTSKHAPPGRKVGLIAASRTGRRKGKITKKILFD